MPVKIFLITTPRKADRYLPLEINSSTLMFNARCTVIAEVSLNNTDSI